MEDAPMPIIITKEGEHIIERKTFEKERFKIEMGKCQIEEKIIIRIICPNEINLMENQYSYNQLINLVKSFRFYSNLIKLFIIMNIL